MGIATRDSEGEALERIAAEATALLNHPSAVFMKDGAETDAGRRYTFRAPQAIASKMAQKEYTPDVGGYTSLVLFSGWPYVLSPNLDVDAAAGGPLATVGHERKSAESGEGEARSIVAVPIPDPSGDDGPLGAIRASSSHAYAFSRRDVETLRALGRQATVVLRRQAEARERQAFFQTIVDASPHPILAVEVDGTIVAYNDAMGALLGRPKEGALGRSLLEVCFAGRRRLAKSNVLALEANDGRLQNHHTVVYRNAEEGYLSIPVRVDASDFKSPSTGRRAGVVAYFTDLRGPGADTRITTVGKDRDVLLTVDRLTARDLVRLKGELKGDAGLHVLITGETGVGKELLARAAAEALGRPECRFINCAGLTDSILESELFGAESGVATEVHQHSGIFDPKFKGTVILDEVQELSPLVQAKILRVLDTGKVRPVGAKQEVELGDNVRVVALTNADIDGMVAESRFRSDLRFRLHGFRFHVNPLRDRRADIMQLADHFLNLARQRRGGGPEGFSSEAIRALLGHTWPGNVRELRKAVELAFDRATANKANPLVIQIECLPEQIRPVTGEPENATGRQAMTYADLAARVTGLDELVGGLNERLNRLESQSNGGNDVPFAAVLKKAVAEDPGLLQRLKDGGRPAVERFFAERHLSPGRTMLFDLSKQIGTWPSVGGESKSGGAHKAVRS
jgi:transcriptional regulator of aroF, aroG, tyrA and aromatic amino acid transport